MKNIIENKFRQQHRWSEVVPSCWIVIDKFYYFFPEDYITIQHLRELSSNMFINKNGVGFDLDYSFAILERNSKKPDPTFDVSQVYELNKTSRIFYSFHNKPMVE